MSRRDDGSLGASIVDPHGDYFADARDKLVALADFAEEHGEQFVRIESISKTSSGLRSLDLKAGAVRDLVQSFEGAEVASLYDSSLATPYGSASSCCVSNPQGREDSGTHGTRPTGTSAAGARQRHLDPPPREADR